MPISSSTTPVVLQALAHAFRKSFQLSDRYTSTVTPSAHSTAVAADSVAVNTPDRMPTRMITTISSPGSAPMKAASTSPQPGKAPRIG